MKRQRYEVFLVQPLPRLVIDLSFFLKNSLSLTARHLPTLGLLLSNLAKVLNEYR